MKPSEKPESEAISGDWQRSRIWLVLLFGLFAWHGWLTLTLFGLNQPWKRIMDEQPIVEGRHPLHLYHGTLGARSFLRDRTLTCYDPAFQAGYPKTPVFDSGSRPAELFLVFVQGSYSPAVYKIGLALCTLSVPFVFLFLTKRIGASRRGSLVSVALGMLVWWGAPCREAFRQGQIDLLFAGLIALLQIGFLTRYHSAPRGLDWLGIVITSFLGWFLHPLLFVLLAPVLLLFYLGVGQQHRFVWHLLLAGALTLAFVCNLFWLVDWVRFWWVRMPLQVSELTLPHRTPVTVWESSFWGTPAYRALSMFLITLGTAGIFILHRNGQRTTARIVGLTAFTLLGLALGGLLHQKLGRLHSPHLFVPGLFFVVPLAGYALEEIWKSSVKLLQRTWLAGACFASAILLGGVCFLEELPQLAQQARATAPLRIGLSQEQEKIVSLIKAQTTAEGRILWQDLPTEAPDGRWTTLLPLLTERSFLGGLDPNEGIEHTVGGLREDKLQGRPISKWSAEEFLEHCRRYNVGWVVCWTKAVKETLRKWPQVVEAAQFGQQQQGSLFRVDRPLSYSLSGKAVWLGASANQILLRSVEPNEDGVVVLSLHYLRGLKVSPSRVRIEQDRRESKDQLPIPFIRLRMDAPVARLTLQWENR